MHSGTSLDPSPLLQLPKNHNFRCCTTSGSKPGVQQRNWKRFHPDGNEGVVTNNQELGRIWIINTGKLLFQEWLLEYTDSWKNPVTLEQLKNHFFPSSSHSSAFQGWEWCPESWRGSRGTPEPWNNPIPWLLALGIWAWLGGSRGRSSSWTFSSAPFLHIRKSRNTILGHSCCRAHVICCWPSAEMSLSRGWWFLCSWIISFAGFSGGGQVYLLIRI